MRTRSLAAGLLFLAQIALASAQAQTTEDGSLLAKGRLATYDKATGETFFALSLLPTSPPQAPPAVDAVVLFDTSASQTGLYRDDALRALRSFLKTLTEQDRVKVFALDLDAVPLQEGLAAPGGRATQDAVVKIEKRTPLGSTDLPAGLEAAVASLDSESPHARAVLYLGDGLSRANFISDADLQASLANLLKHRVTLYSYAIGPQRDVELLAALANHTGGMLFVDTDDDQSSQLAGVSLARAVKAGVLWPVEATLPESFVQSFPTAFPPLRADRDSILVGVLKGRDPLSLSATFEQAGQRVTMDWRLSPEVSSDEFGFLPKLVELARRSEGRRLPTVGSVALKEVGRVILSDARSLVKLGKQALVRNDARAALSAAESVLSRDPDNPDAQALKRAAEKQLRQQKAAIKNQR